MRIMAEFALERGLPLTQSLSGTGVEPSDLLNPRALVSGEQELQLIHTLVQHFGDADGLGIELGRRYHLTSFGVLGFALLSSPTVREALDVALGCFPLTFAFTRFRVSDSDDETCIVVEDTDVPEALSRIVVERDASALVTVQQDLFPQASMLKRVSFRAEAPTNQDVYQVIFGVEPVFSAPRNEAILDRVAMTAPLPQACEIAQAAAIEQCRRVLAERNVRSQLSNTVRELLISDAVHMPSMVAIANRLHVTTRTLRRRLLEEKTTFLELRDEVRRALAEDWLVETNLAVTQLAMRLGYAEPTSFINAFKRWTGLTPLVYRRTRRLNVD